MWQNWQFFMAKFANFCGKIWQNLGFQMAIFCDTRETLITKTGAPQGCVLYPVLYSIYTNDYRTMDENICLIKFADDTTLHCLLSNSEEAYRSEVNRFCEWCKNNHLTLNVDKTKEIVFDYRRKKEPITPLLIDGKLYLSLIATRT